MEKFEVGSVLSPDEYHTNAYDEWTVLASIMVLGMVTLVFIVSRLSAIAH